MVGASAILRERPRPLLRDMAGRAWGAREIPDERMELTEVTVREVGSAAGAGAKAMAPPAEANARATAASCRIVARTRRALLQDSDARLPGGSRTSVRELTNA